MLESSVLYVCMSVFLSVGLSLCLSESFICMYACLSVCMSLCLFEPSVYVYLSVCSNLLSVCMTVSISLSKIHPSLSNSEPIMCQHHLNNKFSVEYNTILWRIPVDFNLNFTSVNQISENSVSPLTDVQCKLNPRKFCLRQESIVCGTLNELRFP